MAFAFPGLDKSSQYSLSSTSHRYNPGLSNIQLEEKKLNFLERKIKPLIPEHPLFSSDPYLLYKKWIEDKTLPPLQLLAMKAYA
ncbi:MAG: hypothetical protein K1000chlam1_00769, partial [Candidatus Anoxychlamydiales bacterium]|nr:hypothetical protein [Candidatus Anoxychlamydiales bacterium]